MPSSDRTDRTLRGLLRAETRDAHDGVDRLFSRCDLSTRSGYVHFLRAQAIAWSTLAPVLDAGSAARLAGVLADLDALGAAIPPPLDAGTMPRPGSLGMGYVLEGSRLGSTVLLRELREKAPELAGQASAYLTRSVEIEGWKAIAARLQRAPADGEDAAIAVREARLVFALFERAYKAA